VTGQPDTATAIAALDQAMKAIILAKSALLGQGGAALLISTDLAVAEASPGNPYGSTKHGRYDAGSAAEVAEGVEPAGQVFACTECDWHSVPGEYPFAGACPRCGSTVDPCQCADAAAMAAAVMASMRHPLARPDLCPARWGEPPETMLCSLASGHDGNHATAEGIEWAGAWRTAEPGDVTR
jgi:hypothetical protein